MAESTVPKRPSRHRRLPAHLRDFVVTQYQESFNSRSSTSSSHIDRLVLQRNGVQSDIERYIEKVEACSTVPEKDLILKNINQRLDKSFQELQAITDKILDSGEQLYPLEIGDAVKVLGDMKEKVEDTQDKIAIALAKPHKAPIREQLATKTISKPAQTPVAPPDVRSKMTRATSTQLKKEPNKTPAGISSQDWKMPAGSPILNLPRNTNTFEPSRSEAVMDLEEAKDIRRFFQGVAKPSIPKFAGEKVLFRDWWEQFDIFVHQAEIPTRIKMVMLKNALTGKAADLAKGLGYTEVQYLTAIKKLHDRYGGDKRVLQTYIEAILKVEPIEAHQIDKLETFANQLQDIVAKLHDAGQGTELVGPSTLYILVQQKVPDDLLVLYRNSLTNPAVDGLEHFVDWFSQQVNLRIEMADLKNAICAKKKERLSTQQKFGKRPNKQVNRSQGNATGTEPDTQKASSTSEKPALTPTCPICQGSHTTQKCEKWQKSSIQERWDIAKKNKICYRCLKTGHMGKNCFMTGKCGIGGCDKTHHRSLHITPKPAEPTQASTSAHVIRTDRQASLGITEDGQVVPTRVALRLLPIYLVGVNGVKRQVNAFLDDGSDSTYLRADVAQDMGLEVQPSSLSLSTLVERGVEIPSGLVQLRIESIDGTIARKIGARTLPKMCENLPTPDWAKIGEKWPHLEGIPFPKMGTRKKVDVLIGSDHPELTLAIEERVGNEGEPVARLTPLGWTCVGSLDMPEEAGLVHYSQPYHGDDVMDDNLRKLWNADAMPYKGSVPFTPDEKAAISKTERSLEFLGDRYKVAIPWVKDRPNLQDNRKMAEKRLVSLENSLKKTPTVAQQYRDAIKGNIEKGYFRELAHNETLTPGWYLPHFGVVRQDRETTKVRVVYDSAATYAGRSLNEEMLTGPKQQLDIVDILISFRQGTVALIGDIKEMFCQVVMDEKDRRYHRILWRDLDSSVPIKVYEATRLTFGDRASPFLAQFVIRTHAKQHQQEYPLAAEVCLESIYIDDVMKSLESAELVTKLRIQLEELLQKGGFVIRKWCSNSMEVMQDIPPEDRATGIVELEDSELPCVKSLGVKWNSATDVFGYSHTKVEIETATKRILLSVIARLFDPLQLLAPFLIRARIMLQQAWLLGLDWDEPFPPELDKQVIVWAEELNQVTQFEVPRCLHRGQPVEESLHTFTDASERAYGAVVYVRSQYSDGTMSVRIAIAKAKVAPLKAVSIPRLELLGALVGLRLAVRTSELLGINSQFFWTDSMDVVYWVHGTSRQYKPFVAHRVAEIQEKSTPTQWKHVPGSVNPADMATRGASMDELLEKSLWTEGPDFLKESQDKWPQKQIRPMIPSAAAEKDSGKSMTNVTQTELAAEPINGNRFSTWLRLVRTTAWVLRFVKMVKTRSPACQKPYLTPEEIEQGEAYWIRQIQQERYGALIRNLREGKPASNNPLKDLTPFLDQDGLLRVGGRLQRSDLPYEARHPLIVPARTHITTLLVRHAHSVVGRHSKGVNAVLAELRQKHWVVSGREEAKRVGYDCVTCRRRKQKSLQQIMAPLPDHRVTIPLRAFSRIGVDFAGPFITKITRRVSAKRWLCLFTCTATRAVHLEMAYSMDTPGFLNTFSRMAARRGKPEKVVSDNGTNFVGANRELGELIQALDHREIIDKGASEGIEWKFNPPLGSHHGGLFEALVKSAKSALKAILGEASLTDEELNTAIVEVEGLLNSRPLTYASNDPKDEEVLTPNHFLIGQAGGQLAPRVVDQIAFNPRHRWRYVQDLVKQTWKRWNKEFLSLLQTRGKWQTEQQNLMAGDVVLMADSANPRGTWPIGRVVETLPGEDGHVRTAKVLSGGKTFIRPITKLSPLVPNDLGCVKKVADRFGHGGEDELALVFKPRASADVKHT